MSEKYFEKFQIINYANTTVVNITQRTVVLNSVFSNPNIYYLYNIKPYERPDTISDEYYEDQYMSWVLYLTNKMVDPYYDWSLDNETFKNFIIKKYGSLDNATSKIKYYRNNWYTEVNPITVSAYNSLVTSNSALAKFYTATYLDELKDTSPNGYVRKKEDWIYNTNMVASYQVANGSSFVLDEIVDVTFDTNTTGRGQVSFSNSSTVVLQHLFNNTLSGTIDVNSYLFGRESKANTTFTAVSSIANNIPSVETSYWEPVTYYMYEEESNFKNNTIQVMNKKYTTQIAKELKRLLK